MDKKYLKQDIETQLIENRGLLHSGFIVCEKTLEYYKNALRDNNELLGKVKTYLNTCEDEYERGVRECWDAMKKVCLFTPDGGLSITELEKYFPDWESIQTPFKCYDPFDIITKIKEYEQKKAEEEEAAKIHIGDVVKVKSFNGPFGIVTSIDQVDKKAKVLWQDFSYRTSERYLADLEKTGKHVDIQGFVKKEMGE